MEHVKSFEKRFGVDIGYNESNMHPTNNESCVGKSGIDKNLTLTEVITLAYKMENKPNIIIKAGQNAKWYFKSFPKDIIESEITKQNWRDVSRCTMYIIEWDS